MEFVHFIYCVSQASEESAWDILLLLSHLSCVRFCVIPQTAATRLPCPWDSPGKNTGVRCHFLLQCMKVKSEREVAQSCPTLSDPMDCSLPGSSIHWIFQAEYWSGMPRCSINTADQSHSEVLSHTSQSSHHQKVYKQ